MVFAVAVLSDAFATGTFKVQTGGVEKDQFDFSEQVAALLENMFFDFIFARFPAFPCQDSSSLANIFFLNPE